MERETRQEEPKPAVSRPTCSHCGKRPAIATRDRKDGSLVHTCYPCLDVDEADMRECP